RRPRRRVEAFEIRLHPLPDVQIARHRHIVLVKDRIAPGAESLEAGGVNPRDSAVGPAVEIAFVGRAAVPVPRDEACALHVTAVLKGLNGGDGVEELAIACGTEVPPDAVGSLSEAPETVGAAYCCERT